MFFELGLSVTEVKVAEFMCQGLNNKEIGELMFVSDKTIKFHSTRLFKKLGIKSRSMLIAMTWKSYVDALKEAYKINLPAQNLLE